MRILNLLSIIGDKEIIRIEDKDLNILFNGTPNLVPYELVLKYIDKIYSVDGRIDICIK